MLRKAFCTNISCNLNCCSSGQSMLLNTKYMDICQKTYVVSIKFCFHHFNHLFFTSSHSLFKRARKILFAPASKHSLPFTIPPITCSAANDAFPVQLTGFVWWMQRYLNVPLAHWQIPAPASLFLNVFTTERGRKDGSEISDSPKTCSGERYGSQDCTHSSPTTLTLFCCLFLSVISGMAHDSARSAPPLQTLHIDSLLIIYRAGRRVCRASSQVLLSIMDGWSYHPCTQSGNDICKKSSKQISPLICSQWCCGGGGSEHHH